jgi:hypothetical protein
MKQIINSVGRIARPGQKDPNPEWTTIECIDEPFDAVSIARRDKLMSEREAIMMSESAEKQR